MSFFLFFPEKTLILLENCFKIESAVKPWEQIQEEYGPANTLKFKWIQLIHSLPKPWIEQIFIDLHIR